MTKKQKKPKKLSEPTDFIQVLALIGLLAITVSIAYILVSRIEEEAAHIVIYWFLLLWIGLDFFDVPREKAQKAV